MSANKDKPLKRQEIVYDNGEEILNELISIWFYQRVAVVEKIND